ncbi:hypothetical protein BDQ17DRAFT_1337137 [Cyathus striatus]|nr:hypothetical protein BDQ17DRAFT_1337137 [Cyathus striatus]
MYDSGREWKGEHSSHQFGVCPGGFCRFLRARVANGCALTIMFQIGDNVMVFYHQRIYRGHRRGPTWRKGTLERIIESISDKKKNWKFLEFHVRLGKHTCCAFGWTQILILLVDLSVDNNIHLGTYDCELDSCIRGKACSKQASVVFQT